MSGNTARRAAITAATNYKHAGAPLDYKESPATSLFGTNVFGLGHHEGAAAQGGLSFRQAHDRDWNVARSARRRRGRRRHEGLGALEGSHPLRARLLPAHRPQRRQAGQLPLSRRRGRSHHRVRGQDVGPGRIRCVELPQRRDSRHQRGPRLHRVGRDQPGLPARDHQRHHAVHPDRLRVLDRRGARQENAAPAFGPGAQHAGRPHPQAVRPRETRDGGLLRGRGAGILSRSTRTSSMHGPTCSTPGALSSAPGPPRGRSSRTTTSGSSPSG